MLLNFLCLQLALFFSPPVSFSTKSSRCLWGRADMSRAGGSSPMPPQGQTPLRSCPAAGLRPRAGSNPHLDDIKLKFPQLCSLCHKKGTRAAVHPDTPFSHLRYPTRTYSAENRFLFFSRYFEFIPKKCPNFHLFATEYCLSSCFIFSA